MGSIQPAPVAVKPAAGRRTALAAAAAALRAALELVEAEAAETEPRRPHEAPNPMLTVAEAAVELACSPAHVRSLCAAGALRAMKTPGGRYRIRTRDLRAYERRSTVS